MTFKTPLVYIIFNRPHQTSISFDVIKKIKPKNLFIIADGPRNGNKSDILKCKRVRKIVSCIDWECLVKCNYSEINLGLKNRVSTGLDWVFDQVDRAIILEDDCVPHIDFFNFCDFLLEYYKDNSKISVITGNNFQNHRPDSSYSYYFTKFCHCWGWATWKRAWSNYDGQLKFWPSWAISTDWESRFYDNSEKRFWAKIFTKVFKGKIDSWAFPWTACNWYNNNLTVAPNVNLVSNIGFGNDGSHTKSKLHKAANLPAFSLSEIVHPLKIEQDKQADARDYNYHFGGKMRKLPHSLYSYPLEFLKRLY